MSLIKNINNELTIKVDDYKQRIKFIKNLNFVKGFNNPDIINDFNIFISHGKREINKKIIDEDSSEYYNNISENIVIYFIKRGKLLSRIMSGILILLLKDQKILYNLYIIIYYFIKIKTEKLVEFRTTTINLFILKLKKLIFLFYIIIIIDIEKIVITEEIKTYLITNLDNYVLLINSNIFNELKNIKFFIEESTKIYQLYIQDKSDCDLDFKLEKLIKNDIFSTNEYELDLNIYTTKIPNSTFNFNSVLTKDNFYNLGLFNLSEYNNIFTKKQNLNLIINNKFRNESDVFEEFYSGFYKNVKTLFPQKNDLIFFKIFYKQLQEYFNDIKKKIIDNSEIINDIQLNQYILELNQTIVKLNKKIDNNFKLIKSTDSQLYILFENLLNNFTSFINLNEFKININNKDKLNIILLLFTFIPNFIEFNFNTTQLMNFLVKNKIKNKIILMISCQAVDNVDIKRISRQKSFKLQGYQQKYIKYKNKYLKLKYSIN